MKMEYLKNEDTLIPDGPIVTPDGPDGDVLPPISGAWGVWAYGEHILVGDTNRGLIVLDYIPYSISTPL